LTAAAGQLTSDAIAFAGALRSARSVSTFCHRNPDADTVAGAIAVAQIAERLGKPSEIVSADPIPPVLGYLPRVDEVRLAPGLEPDVAVVCDAASLDRLGRVVEEAGDWFAAARIVNVDHHVTNTRFGEINLVDPKAAATCEILARCLPLLELPLDRELATTLLTGIVRDSHGFSDRGTSAETLRVAATLVEAGAELPTIHRRILTELPYRTMWLWGRMLNSLGQSADGRIVYAVLLREMLEHTGTEQHDADGLAEFMANAKGADVTILVRELEPSVNRVSLRVTEAVDAAEIARAFGGGGHARRAGCTIHGSPEEAVRQLLDVSARALRGEALASPGSTEARSASV
jgi:phosphoesterase RecJ-like protein